jgi:hypothetical protein
MPASSLTSSILLPQFNDTDKPTWLGDFNSAMRKIDAAFAAKEAEINTLTTQLNAANTALTAANARITALAAVTGHVGI